MPSKTAFLFPGQGSQSIGMGKEITNYIPEAKEIFDQVDEICGRSISTLCLNGPMDELTLTVNLQPAVTAVNLICLRALKNNDINPAVSAGHSLGEFAALVSAGVVSEYDALRLVSKRGELMHREATAHPGAMAAVLGLEINEVAKIVDEAAQSNILAVANHNTAQQIVITGEKEPMERALKLVKEHGAKAIPLKVSGAWHCDLMAGAVEEFRAFMNEIVFSSPSSPIIFNTTGAEERDPESIRKIMARQLVSPVKWYDIVTAMAEQKIECYVEVGPKKVLSGLVNKIIDKDSAKILNVEDITSLKSCVDAVKE